MEHDDNGTCERGLAIIRTSNRIPTAVFDHRLVKNMSDVVPAHSKECVMEAFGISANTWVKIKRGEPIRLSTAEHLLSRLERKGWIGR
jgi:hypothetical protein